MATEEASSRVTKAGAACTMPASVIEMQTGEHREGSSRTITILHLPVCPSKNCFDNQQEQQI